MVRVYSAAARFSAGDGGGDAVFFAGVTTGFFAARFFGTALPVAGAGSELAKLKSELSGAFWLTLPV